MRRMGRIAILLAAVSGFTAAAQTGAPTVMSQGEVVILSLFNPIYPALARTARITGDVHLKIGIRKDGSIESAVALSGHPLLTEAALNSAKQSRFECRGCGDEGTSYSLTYSFQFGLDSGSDSSCPGENKVHVSQSQNLVNVVAEPSMIIPYFASIQVRSAKCAYLWRCGSNWGGEDYYYYRLRSAKCLDLWNCGHRLREPFATCNRLHASHSADNREKGSETE